VSLSAFSHCRRVASARPGQRESSMQQLSEKKARPRVARALGRAAAALLCVAALCQPNLTYAVGGGGGFHGGGSRCAPSLSLTAPTRMWSPRPCQRLLRRRTFFSGRRRPVIDRRKSSQRCRRARRKPSGRRTFNSRPKLVG